MQKKTHPFASMLSASTTTITSRRSHHERTSLWTTMSQTPPTSSPVLPPLSPILRQQLEEFCQELATLSQQQEALIRQAVVRMVNNPRNDRIHQQAMQAITGLIAMNTVVVQLLYRIDQCLHTEPEDTINQQRTPSPTSQN